MSYSLLCTQKIILREVTLTITIYMKYILLPIYNHKSTIELKYYRHYINSVSSPFNGNKLSAIS